MYRLWVLWIFEHCLVINGPKKEFHVSLDQIVPVLQLSIGPVIVISGVGLVLLSMTNRYIHLIDRSRNLAELLRTVTDDGAHHYGEQILILAKRARLLRLAIAFASTSLLLAAFLVIALFIVALFGLPAALLIVALFIGCMICLIVSLIIFLIDINVSLSAFKIEVNLEHHEKS